MEEITAQPSRFEAIVVERYFDLIHLGLVLNGFLMVAMVYALIGGHLLQTDAIMRIRNHSLRKVAFFFIVALIVFYAFSLIAAMSNSVNLYIEYGVELQKIGNDVALIDLPNEKIIERMNNILGYTSLALFVAIIWGIAVILCKYSEAKPKLQQDLDITKRPLEK